ncbi:D site-binding protein [Carlito syrichta]|uniref:D site-binding protein n=1 Tax=Carlito syrichta TaxID=1868482 RepID=A0A3Q0DM61_CARSF|nr:D site-binding protein [Carlito syrichta]
MARPVSDRTPAPLLLGGPAGAPPGGGALLGLRSLLQGTGKPKEPASCELGIPGHNCPRSDLRTEAGPYPSPPHIPAPRESSPPSSALRARAVTREGAGRGNDLSFGHEFSLTSRDTPSPVDPDTVEVLMTFEPDPADLALSSIPGHETFDPRRHRFSEEELKPQPIMKKARKIQVPEEQKDEKYWSRRYKNNEAAKRSRDARRLKENQISVRAAFLEKENALLRQEVVAVRQELSHYRAVLSRYQAQHGAL